LQPGAGQSKNTTPTFSYPSPETVKGRVLADLISGMCLTHMDVWERHGSSRASHHVLMLRRAGFPIRTQEIDAKTRDGRTARIARYSLPAEAIASAGERGRRFADECYRVEAERGTA
jgi:hypothetical protein